MALKLIQSTGTEFAQNLKNVAMINTSDRAGKPTMIASTEFNTAYSNADDATKALFNVGSTVQSTKTVDVTYENIGTGTVTITPDTGYNGVATTTVNINVEEPVTVGDLDFSSGDATVSFTTSTGEITLTVTKPVTLIPSNIKSGATIFGVEGTA